MSDRPNAEPDDGMIFYTIRFPIEWEPRIEALQHVFEQNKPAELLKVSAAAVIRRAFRIGLNRLVEEYGEPDAR